MAVPQARIEQALSGQRVLLYQPVKDNWARAEIVTWALWMSKYPL